MTYKPVAVLHASEVLFASPAVAGSRADLPLLGTAGAGRACRRSSQQQQQHRQQQERQTPTSNSKQQATSNKQQATSNKQQATSNSKQQQRQEGWQLASGKNGNLQASVE